MKRTFLFVITNLAVMIAMMVAFHVICALLGVEPNAAFKGTMVFVAVMVAGVALMDFSLAKIARRRGAALAATLFIVSFVFAPGMGFLSSKDFANPAMNWIFGDWNSWSTACCCR